MLKLDTTAELQGFSFGPLSYSVITTESTQPTRLRLLVSMGWCRQASNFFQLKGMSPFKYPLPLFGELFDRQQAGGKQRKFSRREVVF